MQVVRALRPNGPRDLDGKEWLVANGLGGYACGTVAGMPTRRYHGILVASLPAPLGRMMMLNHLADSLHLADGTVIDLRADGAVTQFRLEWGLPVWRFEAAGMVIEKRLVMPHQQNTTYVQYRVLEGEGVARLELEPWFQYRGHDRQVDEEMPGPYRVAAEHGRFEIKVDGVPPTRLKLLGEDACLAVDEGMDAQVFYSEEEFRDYAANGHVWSPGHFAVAIGRDHPATLVASTEDWHVALAMGADEAWEYEIARRRNLVAGAHPALRDDVAAELVVTADSFVITPLSRIAEQIRARSQGEDIRAIVAGYHWFAVWGRDTMIALEGLALVTGRAQEARWVLQTFLHHVKDGLIPNDFPDQAVTGQYNTADATLWAFHALDRYVAHTGDTGTLAKLMPLMLDIIAHHQRGTHFGIRVDPADGLLKQGAEGYQLTWMDAKVGDWVVTPRRGKAVEINALWYNALMAAAGWARRLGDCATAELLEADAARAKQSFNARFWNPTTGWLNDVVDDEQGGDDATLRPNQVFAVSLPHPVLDESHWPAVVGVLHDRLLTPLGLRSLPADHPEYQPIFVGGQHSRDAAYHRGTVWGFLIGHFVDAWLKVHPDDSAGARRFLMGFVPHLDDFGLGSIAEVFDAAPPHTPRGCISQAWSVAEWLRAWVRTAD